MEAAGDDSPTKNTSTLHIITILASHTQVVRYLVFPRLHVPLGDGEGNLPWTPSLHQDFKNG
eukprot:372507-Hanusia_phi.AAC.5